MRSSGRTILAAQGLLTGVMGARIGESLSWHIQIGDISLHHYIFGLIAIALLIGFSPILKKYSVFPFLLFFAIGATIEEYYLFDWLFVALMAVLIITLSIFIWLPSIFRELVAVRLLTAILACSMTSLLLVQLDFGTLEASKGVIIGLTNALLGAAIWCIAKRRVVN